MKEAAKIALGILAFIVFILVLLAIYWVGMYLGGDFTEASG